jgi:hypothetical protein
MAPRDWWILAAILAAALILRLPGMGWGLPPSTPDVAASDLRCSYAFDEDDLLTHVSFSKPSALDFDPRLYVWGTLHFHLLQAYMESADWFGVTAVPWREAYYRMIPGDFERVYVTARLLSLVLGLLSVALTFQLGRELNGIPTGLWAAALMAASPAHLLASVQIRVDLTAVCLLIATLLIALRAMRTQRRAELFFLGLAAGLAVTAKYSAAAVALPVLLVALAKIRFRPDATGLVVLGCALGWVAGEPYSLIRWSTIGDQMENLIRLNLNLAPGIGPTTGELLQSHAGYAARFLLGPIAIAAALAGFAGMLRQRADADWLVLAAVAGGALGWIPLVWPLLRYQLPLLPLIAVAAGTAIERCPRAWRSGIGSAALVFPLAASLDQLRFMRAPHPANQALTAIMEKVPRGTAVARLTAEMPPLDPKVHPRGPNPFLDDLTQTRPVWVLITDLPVQAYPQRNRHLLADEYDLVDDFHLKRTFAWATLGELGAPHDWKYTHPRMILYRRRAQ